VVGAHAKAGDYASTWVSGRGIRAERRASALVELAQHLDRVLVALAHDLVEARPLQQPDLYSGGQK